MSCQVSRTLFAIIAGLALAGCGGGGGGSTAPASGALTIHLHLLDQDGNPCAGLQLTYSDPSSSQHTVTADASGTSTISVSQAGTYYLNDASYESYHYGPGSMSLGTVKASDVAANRVFDYYGVYDLATEAVDTIGPVPEDTGHVLTNASVVGTWYFTFQWKGRSQGALHLTNAADGTCLVPGGQAGDSATAVTGYWYVNGNGDELSWVLSDGTVWCGPVTSSTSLSGMMETNGHIGQANGNTGTFTAHM